MVQSLTGESSLFQTQLFSQVGQSGKNGETQKQTNDNDRSAANAFTVSQKSSNNLPSYLGNTVDMFA